MTVAKAESPSAKMETVKCRNCKKDFKRSIGRKNKVSCTDKCRMAWNDEHFAKAGRHRKPKAKAMKPAPSKAKPEPVKLSISKTVKPMAKEIAKQPVPAMKDAEDAPERAGEEE